MNAVFQKTGVVIAASLVLASSGAGIAFAKEGKTPEQKAAHAAKIEKKSLTATAVNAKQEKQDKKDVKDTKNTKDTKGGDGLGSDLQAAIKAGNVNDIKRIAQAMISERVQSMTDLKSKVSGLKHISADDKSSLMAKVQSNLDAMIALRTKIGNDTDLNTLIKDAQSITKEYQIGTLANPQVMKMAVADRVESVLSVYQDLIPKLQSRINDMTGVSDSGNKSRAQAALDDMKAKLNDAQKLAQAAESMVSDLSLSTDQASKDANAKVFAQAQNKLQAAHDDLKAARADLDTIQKILKGKR